MPIKNYTKEELTVHWRSDLCIHSAVCVNGLKEVFNPKARPWINLDGADKELIIEQVKKCPSGAISLIEKNSIKDPPVKIDVLPNGPLQVLGDITIIKDGEIEVRQNTNTLLCRCGASKNKPFCDGHHRKVGFEG